MASFVLSRPLIVLLVSLLSLFSSTSLSFSFTSSDKNASFASDDIALYGDAKLVDGGSTIQRNDSVSHGGGGVVYKKPIESVDTESEYFTELTTDFSFLMPRGCGGRIGFVMFPANGTFDLPFLQVKFDISEDNFTKFTVNVNGTRVYEKTSNLTIVHSEKGKLLHAWIDYKVSGHCYFGVWSNKAQHFESADSLYISRDNLLNDKDEFMVGLKLYSGNFSLLSWGLGAGYFSKNMPSNAEIRAEKRQGAEDMEALMRSMRRRGNRMMWPMWKIVTCLVMTFGFTGLVFFAMMCIWAAFKRNDLAVVRPEECGLKTEKLEVVMSKAEAKQERK